LGAKKKKTRKSRIRKILKHRATRVLLGGVILVCTLSLGSLVYFYLHFAALTDQKLAEGPIGRTATLFGGPRRLIVGDEITSDEIAAELTRTGYGRGEETLIGWFDVRRGSVEIHPGEDSYFAEDPVILGFERGRLERIVSLRDNTERTYYDLEPELITNLFNHNRERRRLVRFEDIPAHLVNAILAAEDKRFFQHAGFDPIRVLKAGWVTFVLRDRLEGASTLSMQLAGDVWLDRSQRTYRRKAAEVLITLHLERKLTKEQIFEYYANQIYLGRVGTFDIHGYGQAAQAYFEKEIGELTLPEAALLAGLPQAPSRYNPFRNPERAKARRNLVLGLMLESELITETEYAEAGDAPLDVRMGGTEVGDAPYFVDLVNGWLREQFPEHDFQNGADRVYTTLDMNLQREAVEAVRVGMEEIDKLVAARGRTPERGWPEVQAVLVALDPRTGAVKALVGGRSYAGSQLNRAVAHRQPGSVFKPFVFAAALGTGVDGGSLTMTNQFRILDEPTTFWYDDKPYEPHNYKDHTYGWVTLREALTRSLNIPTVMVAEKVGYDKVVEVAHRAGLNMDIMPTPSVALGSYEVTPLEIAGAYTMFANQGEVSRPHFIRMIRERDGETLFAAEPVRSLALDPRVAYLMVNLMEHVIQSGTGIRVRLTGFDKPAAGKTGTSHDGWFAGFTSELLCVVWVGYDDNRELELEGAQSALPIWTEFMKRSTAYREYREPKPFAAPDGIVTAEIDPETGKLAGTGCGTDPVSEVFIAGTQPVELCSGSGAQVAGWDVPEEGTLAAANLEQAPKRRPPAVDESVPRQITLPPPAEAEEPRKGFFGRLLDIFR